MRSRVEFEKLVQTTRNRLAVFIDRVGPGRCYAAYSGGKDSKAVLLLARSVCPQILAVHNEHPGEVLDRNDVLVVKPPKKENVPAFLKTVGLVGQIDGTRRDEDKTVIFNGEEIHRGLMPTYETDNGVFGLECHYPLYEWTEEDVFRYLNDDYGAPVLVRDVRFSYEGEGPLIGKKSLYLRYPGDVPLKKAVEPFMKQDIPVDAIYITAEYLTRPLFDSVRAVLAGRWENEGAFVTIEVPANQIFSGYMRYLSSCMWFVRCEDKVDVPDEAGVYIKIEVDAPIMMQERVELANWFAEQRHQVLLMPKTSTTWLPNEVGRAMMSVINTVHQNVRIMPPAHKLIGIP